MTYQAKKKKKKRKRYSRNREKGETILIPFCMDYKRSYPLSQSQVLTTEPHSHHRANNHISTNNFVLAIQAVLYL